MTQFNLLALVEAGLVKEDDNTLGLIQNIEPEHAHAIAKWLVLTTGTPAHLRLIGIGAYEDIHYTPEQVQESIRKAQERSKADLG